MAQLPTMEEHADATHPVAKTDPAAPWGRDAKGRPMSFQDSIAQGKTAPPAKPAPAPSLIDALTPKVKK